MFPMKIEYVSNDKSCVSEWHAFLICSQDKLGSQMPAELGVPPLLHAQAFRVSSTSLHANKVCILIHQWQIPGYT